MRAIQVEEFGGPEVLVQVQLPDPVPAEGEVLVDVAFADTLFVETQLRRGWGREWFHVQPPYVPGGAVSGTVAEVGAGVDGGWRGREVVAHTGQRGGYADRVAVSVDALVPVPDSVPLDVAAALLHDGVTALSLLDAVPVRRGDRVLVTAAAGGMGVLLVQLAVAAGARVVGAARGQRKLDLVTAQGADAVDYTLDGWTDRVVELAGGAPDVVFDGTGGELGAAAFGIVADGGRFSSHGASSGEFNAGIADQEDIDRRQLTVTGIEAAQHDPSELPTYAAHALAAAAEGTLRPVIGRRFPLSEAAGAHAAIEARQVPGKALLVP